MRTLSATALAVAALMAADGWREEVLRWRTAREIALQAEGGWLSVAGLFWLKEGANAFGTSPDNAVVLPAGRAPARAGVFELQGGRVTAVVDGTRRTLSPDSPDAVTVGRIKLFVIKRAGRYGIRMKDPESRFRREFHGLHWYRPNPAWRVTARFVSEAREIPIANVLGQTEPQHSPGYAEFDAAGQRLRLYAILEPGSRELNFILRDQTSGKETYGAGRFLDTALPVNGRVVLDFNKAYNPPCAFTPYATCPLPPRENRLPVRIEAGELKYGEH